MRRFLKNIIFLALIVSAVLTVSCRRINNPFSDRKVLAEVGDAVLYESDVASIFTTPTTPEDSLKLLRNYVDRWVKLQLKVQEAQNIFASTQKDIDKMVEDYRNSLLNHKVDQYYVDKQMDTLFTDQQIKEYYNENKKDFILDKTIVKGSVVRVPQEFRQLAKLKELMLSDSESSYRDFVDMCTKNKLSLTEYREWSDFGQMQLPLPTKKDGEYDFLLKGDKIHEILNGQQRYLVRVSGKLLAGEHVPIERVADVIKRVIFTQRKEAIIHAHEDSLYNQAIVGQKAVVNLPSEELIEELPTVN